MLDPDRLRALLEGVERGDTSVEGALSQLARPQPRGLDFAELDLHRPARTGHPEAIYGAGKTPAQIAVLVERFRDAGQDALVTRVSDEMAAEVQVCVPEVEWLPIPRLLLLRSGAPKAEPVGSLLVVCAGTSDLPVAEEAAVTAELLGNRVTRIADVGVAGLHRILGHHDALRTAHVIVVVAGMEGALASVVAGLVSCPVLAVPTSVGYGAAFGGVAALLGMLNSCAPGVSVLNIDNGYGAAITASRINRAIAQGRG